MTSNSVAGLHTTADFQGTIDLQVRFRRLGRQPGDPRNDFGAASGSDRSILEGRPGSAWTDIWSLFDSGNYHNMTDYYSYHHYLLSTSTLQ